MTDSIIISTEVDSSTVITSIDVDSSTVISISEQGPIGLTGAQGPIGLTGASGASASITYIAGETLGGHRGVILDNSTAIYADNTILSHANKLIGLTTGATLIGETTTIQSSGELDGFSGLVVNSKVYLQASGVLTTTLPTTGFIQQVGIAVTDTKILINIQPSLVIG